jgi:hypothetical protein
MGTTATGSIFLAGTFALVTALFWGTYGPILHKGSHYMGSYVAKDPKNPDAKGPTGRMRPFLCVGLAYFVIAVLAPLLMIQFMGVEKGAGIMAGWSFSGIAWSFAGGAVGALGAFALIMALNNGTPVQVMPLVFGVAPVISVATGMYLNKTLSQVSPFFFVGMLLVILGAVTILLTAPGPKAPGAHKPETPTEKSAKEEGKNPLADEKK